METNNKMELEYKMLVNSSVFNEYDEEYNQAKISLFKETHKFYNTVINKVYCAEQLETIFIDCMAFIKNNEGLFTNIKHKFIFISDILIYDDERFINLVRAVGINQDNISNFVREIERNNKIYKITKDKNIEFSFKKNIEKLKQFTGLYNTEILINKILKLYYLDNDFLFRKEKIKRES